MKKLLSLFIALLAIPLFGQNETVKTKDFNKDGVIDTLKCHYEGGSGFGGNYCSILDGKTKKSYELNNFGSFSSIKHSMLITPELLNESNKEFLEELKSNLLPYQKDTPDPSLRWILDCTKNIKILKNHKYFDFLMAPESQWYKGNVLLPNNYSIELNGEDFNLLYNSGEDNYPKISSKSSKGFVSYYGGNHFSDKINPKLEFIDSNECFDIYSSNHGVLVKKGENYKWVFVSDIDLIKDLRPLRIKSINEVNLYGDYLIVKINQYELKFDVYFINIDSGEIGKLKGGPFRFITSEDRLNEEEYEFFISEYEDEFIFIEDNTKRIVTYSELAEELKKLKNEMFKH